MESTTPQVDNVETTEPKTQDKLKNAMAFDDDDEFQSQMMMVPDITEADQELLQIQRRKSTPKVIIQEFVHDSDSAGEDDIIEKNEKDCITDCEADKLHPGKPHKIKTHFEIDNVRTTFLTIFELHLLHFDNNSLYIFINF